MLYFVIGLVGSVVSLLVHVLPIHYLYVLLAIIAVILVAVVVVVTMFIMFRWPRVVSILCSLLTSILIEKIGEQTFGATREDEKG